MKNKGFTLVEVLAVISLIGVLIILFTPSIISIFNNAKHQISYMNKQNIIDAGKLYVTDLLNKGTETVDGKTVLVTYNGLSGYDFKSGICTSTDQSLTVSVKYLVEHSYYDKECDYNGNTTNCKIQPKYADTCKVTAKFTCSYIYANPESAGQDNAVKYAQIDDYDVDFSTGSECGI